MRIKRKKRSNFTQISNELLHDERLSWKAKGIMGYLLSLPDDWIIYFSEITNHATDGETSFRSGVKELKKYGYLERNPIRDPDSNKIVHWETLIVEEPSKENPQVENPQVENPPSGKRQTTNTLITNTLNNNTINTNKKDSSSEPRYGPDDDCYKLSELLYKMAKQNNEKFKEPNMQKWSNDFRLMMEQDNYTPLEIQNLIVFSQRDDFWKGNILSASKLRKQAITLTNQLNRAKSNWKQPAQQRRTPNLSEYDDLSL